MEREEHQARANLGRRAQVELPLVSEIIETMKARAVQEVMSGDPADLKDKLRFVVLYQIIDEVKAALVAMVEGGEDAADIIRMLAEEEDEQG